MIIYRVSGNPVKSRVSGLFPKKCPIHNSAINSKKSIISTLIDTEFYNQRTTVDPFHHGGGHAYYFALPNNTVAVAITGLNVFKDYATNRTPINFSIFGATVQPLSGNTVRCCIDIDWVNPTEVQQYFTNIRAVGYAFISS